MQNFFCALLFTLCSVVPALGWDDVGHKITSYIAWQRMSPTARENVIRILRSAPEDSHLSAYYFRYGPEPEAIKKLEYFMLASTWADIIRDRAFENREKKYHHSNWHYDDTFWRQVNGRVEILKGIEEGGVAVEKLYDFDKTIREASASDREKAIAIAWLMHLIGDLHQPLHTSARVTDREPKGDQGGNLFLLTPEGTPRENQVNIHWFWDSITGRNIPLRGETCERDYIVPIARRIMNKHRFASFAGSLRNRQYRKWQEESFAFTPTHVFTPDLVRFKMPSEGYKRRAFALAERQLALAGYRLGELLNSVFNVAPVAANSQCPVIRKIMYPVFKKTPENSKDAKPTIALLNICPPELPISARPTIMVDINGRRTARAFDVIKTFADETTARQYAMANSISDINLNIQ